jgi:hypothetical protein
MNRREFLINAYRVGGIVALAKLGVSLSESKAIAGTLQDAQRALINKRNAVPAGGCSGYYGFQTGITEIAATTFQMHIQQVEIDCSGIISSIEAEISGAYTANREVVFLIYEDNAGEPSNKLYSSVPTYFPATEGVYAWSGVTGSLLEVTPGTYWIGVLYEYGGSGFKYSASSGVGRNDTNADMKPPAVWDTAGDTTSTAAKNVRIGF